VDLHGEKVTGTFFLKGPSGASHKRRLSPFRRPRLVLAEIEELGCLASQRVLDELLVALGTQVEAQLTIDVRADLIAISFLQLLEDVLNFLKVIPFVACLVHGHWVERRVDFHFHDVAKVFFRIEFSVTQIATVSNHGPTPHEEVSERFP
jgi:hypothetical protein